MKKLWPIFAAFVLAWVLAFTPACKTPTLAPGGAYAPTNQAPDLVFYEVDSAFYLAYAGIDGMFSWEQQNRATLWAISPDIKRTLDKVRVKATEIVASYLDARAVYLANPVPSNLDTLNATLAKLSQLLETAKSVVPKPKPVPNP